MYKKICLFVFVLLFVMSCKLWWGDNSSKSSSTSNNDEENISTVDFSNSFIKTSGTKFVDEKGNEYKIRGMNFSNNAYTSTNFYQAAGKDHDESSYKELSELGFNTIRYYLNYRMFESDDVPGQFYETTFTDYMDKEIERAKKYRIKIIFNMHAPQGGYQSAGGGTALWVGDNAESNQNRLIALWAEFAKRYADEPAVLGYGLVNEPLLIGSTVDEAVASWSNLATKIATEIRKYDTKHIIFLERAFMIKNSSGVALSYTAQQGYPVIDDNNYSYEIHFYEPGRFTNQGMPWSNSYKDVETTWPDEKNFDQIVNRKSLGEEIARSTGYMLTDYNSTDWKNLRSGFYTITSENRTVANWKLICSNLGTTDGSASPYDGEMLVDFVKIYEKETEDSMTLIYKEDFTSGTGGFNCTGCSISNDGNGHLMIKGGKGYAHILNQSNTVILKPGKSYAIEFWVKLNTVTGNGTSVICQLDPCSADIRFYNRDFLLSRLKPFSEYSKTVNVPFYIGEFGVYKYAFAEMNEASSKRNGGGQWVKDSISVFNELNLAYSYHCYHEDGFGLYCDAWKSVPSESPAKECRINELYQAFVDSVK